MCSCGKKSTLGVISWVLVIIGGINWGLIGLGGFFGANLNVINLILGGAPAIEWIIYLLVGIGALILLFSKKCKHCRAKAGGGAKKEAPMMNRESGPAQPTEGQMASPDSSSNL